MAVDAENIMLTRIVHCIVKAVSEDIPEYIRDQGKETNNAVPHMKSDCINDNLRKMVVTDGVELLPFKRYSYDGRILVNRLNKHSYTITTRNTLQAIPKRPRNSPHFLQSMLFALNGDLEAPVKQMALIDMTSFDEETLEDDYASIVGELLDPSEGYRHYVIVYEANGPEVFNICCELLDKGFDVIESLSLNEYIQPNILGLIDSTPNVERVDAQESGSAKQFVKINERMRLKVSDLSSKASQATNVDDTKLQPKLREDEEQA